MLTMDDVRVQEEIRLRLGAISEDDFERLCCTLFRREVADYAAIEPSYNGRGKTTKGTPDAHVRLPSGQYVAFQFTTQQTDVANKVRSDIAKLASDRCDFRDRIEEVVICLNTVLGDERIGYEEEGARHGWRVQVYSLDALTRLLAPHPDLCNHFLHTALPLGSAATHDADRRFDCGDRVRQVRMDLGLGTGEFIERIGLDSERGLKQIEAESQECPLRLLESVTAFCGVSLEWLKFGTGQPYPTDFLSVLYVERDIAKLQAVAPEQVYWCLETRALTPLLVVQVSDYRWTAFNLGMCLDFWRWIEDFRYLPRFHQMLGAVYDTFLLTSGRILPSRDLFDLLNGQRHPRTVIRRIGLKGVHWAEDLQDIYQKHPSARGYRKEYGRWFPKVQQWLRDYDPSQVDVAVTAGA